MEAGQEQRAEQREALGDKEIRRIVVDSIEEYGRQQAEEKEPAARAELSEERRRREQLEKRLNELVEENGRHRKLAEQAERHAAIKSELQRLGVKKVDLAFRVVKEEIVRGEDGELYGRGDQGQAGLEEFLGRFLRENPEFLPARMAGGSGASGGQRAEAEEGAMDLNRIRPGMTPEEKERARKEIVRLAGSELKGWV